MSRIRVLVLLFIVALGVSVTLASVCQATGIIIGESVFDSPIKKILYASADHQDAYILTYLGTVYHSTNSGKQWTNVINRFPQYDNTSLSYPIPSTGVTDIVGAHQDGLVYFIGHGFAYWTTRGGDIYKLHTTGYTEVFPGDDDEGEFEAEGQIIIMFIPHPVNTDVVLRLVYDAECLYSDWQTCYLNAEVSGYQGADNSWVLVANYVHNAEWGEDDLLYVSSTMAEFITDNGYPDDDISTSQLLRYTNYGLDASADGYDLQLSFVSEFVIRDNILYYIQLEGERNTPKISLDGGETSENMVFFTSEHEIIKSDTTDFYLLDYSDDVTFVAIKNNTSPFTAMFVGPVNQPQFTLSIAPVRASPSEGIDFYKGKNLRGIYFANQYDISSGNENYNQHIQSKISLNQGSLWEKLQTVNGHQVNLMIHTYTLTGAVQNIYSEEESKGILLAHGNEGQYLRSASDENSNTGLYLSRSAGLQWERILDGVHHFAMANRASLFVAAPSDAATNTLKYSWTQGDEWEECTWNVDVVIESVQRVSPTSAGLQFIFLGQFANGEGISVFVDFSPNSPRTCEGDTDLSNPNSDFEVFSSTVGEYCLLGSGESYIRRKRDAACFTQSDEPIMGMYLCPCTRQDYECDGNCFRHVGSECVNICEGTSQDPQQPPANCHGTYTRTQGYRLIAGDVCMVDGGVDLLPQQLPCPEPSNSVTPSLSFKPSPISSPEPTTKTTSSPTSSVAMSTGPNSPSATISLKPSSSNSVLPTLKYSPTSTISPEQSSVAVPTIYHSPAATITVIKTASVVKSAQHTTSVTETRTNDNSESEDGSGFSLFWLIGIIGGAVGVALFGLIIIAGAAFGVYYYKKRKTQKEDDYGMLSFPGDDDML